MSSQALNRGALVQSRAVRVTFFEDRAEVTRRARIAVGAGASFTAIGGVTALVDDPSVVARVLHDEKGPEKDAAKGPARVIATRVSRKEREISQAGEDELQRLQTESQAARVRRSSAEGALKRATSRRDRCQAALSGIVEALKRVPRGGTEGTARFRAASSALDRELSAGLDEVSRRQGELLLAREDEGRVLLRLREGQMLHPRYETSIEVQVDARTAGEVEIEMVYRTPCTLWRPEHLARAVPVADGRTPDSAAGASAAPGHGGAYELALTTWAVVWQATGEEWKDVECRFSTARPAQSASPPLLRDDVLSLRRKTDQEKRTVVVEAREQSIALSGLSRGERAVEEMPGVDDGGEPLWFAALRPATLQSDGLPVRVEIASVRLPCVVDRVCFPERSPAAHLRATATLLGTAPLLAGPVRVARGSELCGRGRVHFVGKGEPFELGLGVDDGIRVRRHVEDRRETVPVLGTQKLTRTVKLYVSNLGGVKKRLVVIERVPVSEIREVEVIALSSTGAALDPRDGMARFEVEVPAGGTREFQISYRIEAAAKVALDWL